MIRSLAVPLCEENLCLASVCKLLSIILCFHILLGQTSQPKIITSLVMMMLILFLYTVSQAFIAASACNAWDVLHQLALVIVIHSMIICIEVFKESLLM